MKEKNLSSYDTTAYLDNWFLLFEEQTQLIGSISSNEDFPTSKIIDVTSESEDNITEIVPFIPQIELPEVKLFYEDDVLLTEELIDVKTKPDSEINELKIYFPFSILFGMRF